MTKKPKKIQNSRARDPDLAWEADGYYIPPWGGPPWLWIYCGAVDRVLAFRPSQLMSRGTLLGIVPEAQFWRRNWKGKNGDADWDAAAAKLISECFAAGESEPPVGIQVRGPGRPRKHEND